MKKFLLLSVLLLSAITAGAQYVFVTANPGNGGEIRVGKSLDLGSYHDGGSFVEGVLPGETVYFDFRAYTGYQFQSIDYGDNLSSDDVTVSPEGIYSFTMPVYKGSLMIMIKVYFEQEVVIPTGVDINEVNFPDPNFRNWLLAQSYGTDAVITDYEMSGITSITARACGIEDLAGIEYFTELTSLDVSNADFLPEEDWNHISTIDLTCNPKLRKLWANYNGLTSINLSNNPDLRNVDVGNNLLEELDVTNCPLLSLLYCPDNQLETLDVTHNPDLGVLGCFGNQLRQLDVSNNMLLEQLFCENNLLTSIDVTNHNKMMLFNCNNNQLTSLDLTGCDVMYQFYCYNNQINGQEMDNMVNSLETPPNGGYMVVIDLDSEIEQNAITKVQADVARAKGWSVEAISGDDFYPYEGSGDVTFLRGDVDGDGNVGIGDVSALIDYLLSGNADGVNLDAADTDQDTFVGIGDVSTLIDYLLKGNW